MRPFQPTAACREGREKAWRRSHVPRHRLSGRSPLQARLAGRPVHVMISLPSAVDVAVGRAWSIPWPRSSSGHELIGTAAPPMMVVDSIAFCAKLSGNEHIPFDVLVADIDRNELQALSDEYPDELRSASHACRKCSRRPRHHQVTGYARMWVLERALALSS